VNNVPAGVSIGVVLSQGDEREFCIAADISVFLRTVGYNVQDPTTVGIDGAITADVILVVISAHHDQRQLDRAAKLAGTFPFASVTPTPPRGPTRLVPSSVSRGTRRIPLPFAPLWWRRCRWTSTA
jgi:hypothetical protein